MGIYSTSKRLPNGYKERVLQAKGIAKELGAKFGSIKGTEEDILKAIRTHPSIGEVKVKSYSENGKPCLEVEASLLLMTYLDLIVAVSYKFMSNRVILCNTCDIYIGAHNQYIYDYEW